MSDYHRRITAVLDTHLTPSLQQMPPDARERLYGTVAASLTAPLAVTPQAVPHPYVHGPAGCRGRIADTVCGLDRDDQAHEWPFSADPAPLPVREWHTLRWQIRNPAAPAHVFDDVNPAVTRSWDREDPGTTGEDVVVLWPGRFSAFYGGWDAGRVHAVWRADRDRLADAGGFVPLPFGPAGEPPDELAEPPHVCDTDYCCW